MPTRFGHEFSGDVAAVGEGVTAFAPGDAGHVHPHGALRRMLLVPSPCRKSSANSVMPTMILGAYSDLIVVPQRIVERNAFRKAAPASAMPRRLSRTACLRRAFDRDARAARRARPSPIVGNGGFGILHALLLQRAGVERDALRAARRALGARARTRICAASIRAREPIREAIDRDARPAAERTRAIECTGTVEMWESAPSLRAARRAGLVLCRPTWRGARQFLAARLHYDEVQLRRAVSLHAGGRSRAFDAHCDARRCRWRG